MRAWVIKLTDNYFETEDDCGYSANIAIEVPPKPSIRAEEEIKIQKEMTNLLREQAIKNLKLTPIPII